MGLIINPRQIIKDGITSLRDVWSSSKVSTELSGKQATLVSGTNIKTINNTSLLGSGDITISGGGEIPKINMTATTATLDPNKFYVWGEVASLDISLAAETAGIENVYKFQFQSGTTVTTLTLPSSVKWNENITPTIFRNTTHIISIESGIAKIERMFTSSLLPTGYQQVEWIESDRTACIVIPFDFSRFVTKLEIKIYPQLYSGINSDYYGARTTGSILPGIGMEFDIYGKLYCWMGTNSTNTVPANIAGAHIVSYEDNTKTWRYDGVAFSTNYIQTSLSQFPYLGIWAYAKPDGTVFPQSSLGKIGELYIATSTFAVRLIPCYHVQSNIRGLYDIINDVFYANYRSSGNFNIGPDV